MWGSSNFVPGGYAPVGGYGPPGGNGGYVPGFVQGPPQQQAMQHLAGVKTVKIKEQIRVLEAITAILGAEIEMANKYDIIDADTDQQLFFAVEKTGFITRQLKGCCNDCAAWDLDILYKGQPAFKLERPWTLTCCCFNRPVLSVRDVSGNQIGSVIDPFTCCNLVFHAQDPYGNPTFSLNGGCCQLGLCCPLPCGPCAKVEFKVESPEGHEIGEITKKIKCLKWIVADDADNYKIKFQSVQDPAHKVLLIALAIFMDFKYFSNNTSDDNGGLIGDLSGSISD